MRPCKFVRTVPLMSCGGADDWRMRLSMMDVMQLLSTATWAVRTLPLVLLYVPLHSFPSVMLPDVQAQSQSEDL